MSIRTQNSPEQTVADATQLTKEGRYKLALEKLAELGAALANNVEGLYVKGVCLRKTGEFEAAIKCFQSVLNIDASYARAHQEVGHIFIASNKTTQAINAFELAVRTDSALIASWRNLEALYAAANHEEQRLIAQRQVQELQLLHPALQTVKSCLNREDIDRADQICRAYLSENKQDVEGLRLLAEIASRIKVLDEAEFILESAVTFQPNHIGARFDYCNILLKRQKFGPAHDIATQLTKEQPENLQFKSVLAATLLGVGETQAAADVLRDLVASDHALDQSYLLLGHAEKTAGNLEAAIAAYQNLYRVRPDFGDAFWSLANTKTYTFTDDEVEHMLEYRNRAETTDVDKVHFNFALGKALEDKKDYAAAFSAYQLGNELNQGLLDYRAPEMAKRVARQKQVCTPELFARLKEVGSERPDPIFIVGLPRAGSTLLEQILASHSQVDGTLELPNILSLSRRLRGRGPFAEDEEPRYPRILAELEHDYFEKFGQQYMDDTQVYRQGAAYFVDKMPNNFLHTGLIKLILPNAKVIDARRHPMACCFSGFKQLFAEGQEFTYGLTQIGDYYRNYVEMMDHWDQVLPGYVLRVQHEDVVLDLETQVRRILDFCGLEFEPACLEFYRTDRNVRTPSSEQVRQPIYTTGLEQWRNFEAYLDPLIEALGEDVMARYPIN